MGAGKLDSLEYRTPQCQGAPLQPPTPGLGLLKTGVEASHRDFAPRLGRASSEVSATETPLVWMALAACPEARPQEQGGPPDPAAVSTDISDGSHLGRAAAGERGGEEGGNVFDASSASDNAEGASAEGPLGLQGKTVQTRTGAATRKQGRRAVLLPSEDGEGQEPAAAGTGKRTDLPRSLEKEPAPEPTCFQSRHTHTRRPACMAPWRHVSLVL
ncbi:unnamed protein product [Rangifer tarandus platyrhynchus]|uniref:Uncharacterized protein n=1 Tax=Rangifer tarandus platyrhynchus TaxID=3082113 RepID=A0AC59ZVR6_RANTA